jgi:hypothetical protein
MVPRGMAIAFIYYLSFGKTPLYSRPYCKPAQSCLGAGLEGGHLNDEENIGDRHLHAAIGVKQGNKGFQLAWK